MALLVASSLFACKKDCVEPITFSDITLRPDGFSGTRYEYRVYCVYDTRGFNVEDSTQTPTLTVSGEVDRTNPYVIVKMDRDEFFYVLGYRDANNVRQYIFFNRHVAAGGTLPATIF